MKNKAIPLALMLAVVMSLLCVSVYAVAPVDGIVAKNISTGVTYEYLEDALDEAGIDETVVLMGDYALVGNTAVAAGATLVIPSSSALNDTFTGNNASGGVITGNPYVTLTVPTGKTLEVNGTLLVAGNQQSTQPASGCLTGDYGRISLIGNLVVNNGGKLYARGEISGAGTVTANDGATVYQMLQIKDWRGGTAALSAYNKGIFPFNLYEFNNITATTVYKNGSALFGQAYIYAGNTHNTCEIPLIGANGQLSFVSAASVDAGNITVTHSNGIATAALNGRVQTGDIAVSLKQYGITFNIRSASTVCPFGYNMNVVIPSGASLNITNNLKFLPGCTVTVEAGGALTVADGKTAYFYADGGYSEDYCFHQSGTPSLIGTGNALLTAETSTDISGTIASTSSTQGNIPYAGAATPVTIEEATQSGTAITAVPVTFYAYTLPATE